MRGVRLTAIILALALSMGLDWAALQAVAWTRMLAGFSQSMPIGQAITQTLDGLHPCTLCLAIRRGREAERKTSSPITLENQVKLEFDLPVAPLSLFLTAPKADSFPASDAFSTRSHAPPKPRPRARPIA
ncbi:MAG: hypothetical protein JNK85_16780 [Verrucomicrobiales bacterium]|nr:hypothetical protein [Verrucomicrobiales bacterium]